MGGTRTAGQWALAGAEAADDNPVYFHFLSQIEINPAAVSMSKAEYNNPDYEKQ